MRLFDYLLQLPFSRRQQRAMRVRPKASRESFIERLGGTPFADVVADAVWQHLRDTAVVEDFQPLPDDDLGELYGIAEEELDEDLLLALISRLGLALPPRDYTTRFGPVRRACDVVRFLADLNELQTRREAE